VNRVESGSFLTLHYRLRGADGAAFVDTFATQPATLSLGTGELAPAMEARLIGMASGSEASFALAAGEAFGDIDPALVQRISRARLDAEGDGDGDYQVGDVVRFPGPEGQTIAAVLRDIDGDALVFDFNHPLAGRPLTFDVKLIGILE
jgi:FKBP-type peptidyl-prolyl cis-trans isomerase SlpA